MEKTDKDMIYMYIANCYMHRNIKKIRDAHYEIIFSYDEYSFPKYQFQTRFIPLIARMNLMFNKQVKKVRFGKKNYLKLDTGVSGHFCAINRYFELTEDFQPSYCYYASKDVAEQLRKKGIDFDFLVYRRGGDYGNRHAVIRTHLPGFKNPVIVDGTISAIIEEDLFNAIQPFKVLAVYNDKELPEEIDVAYCYGKEGGQYLHFEDKEMQDKQFTPT